MGRFYVSEAIFVAVLFALLVSIPPGRSNCVTCKYKSSFGTNNCTIIDNNEINNHTSESSITVTGLESGIPYIFDIGCPEDCCGNYTNTSSTAELHFVQLNSTTLFMNWTGQLPVPNNSFTLCPGFVENLTVYDITVKSLYLNWTVSDCHSPNYLVEWSNLLNQLNSSDYTTNKSFQITSLLPGNSYIFKVTSVFGDTVGNSIEESNNTSPAKVGLITLQNSTNSSLTIGWSTPEGHVDSYTINFVRDDLDVPSNTSGLTNNFTVITGFNAGHIYNVTVTSISGSLANVSESEMFATYPNPPEALRVDYQTNISIVLLWSRPSLMDGVNVTYEVSYTPGFYENCSTSFLNLTNLSPGSQYNITVVTIGVLGNRSPPVSLTAYTVPNMVQNLQVSDPSNSSLTLTWLLPNETSSLILYSVNVSSTPAQILNTTSNTLQVTQLQPGTQYNCSVSAIIVAANLFGPSQSVPCSTKPLPVTNLTTSCVKSTEVCLSWSRQLDYKSSYLYNVSVNGGSANQSYNESVNVTDLLPGKSYSFTVQTVANGLGSESVSLSVFTGLDKASNISAVGTTDSMTVAWTPPSGNLTSYIVELLLNGTVQKTKNQTTGIKPFVVFSDLLPGTVYSVIVKSISGSVNQDSDSVSNATLPTAPGVLCVSSLSTNTLYINWTQPLNMTPGSYSFQLQYSNSSSIPSVVNITNSSSSYYYLSGLQAGVQYKITLTTVGALGYSSPAQSVSAYTNPSSVANITVTKFNETSIILSWQQNDIQLEGYSYLLSFTRPNGTNAQMIVNETSAELLSLKSASAFNISIVTQTPGSTQSDPKFQTVYTKPYPVLSYSFVPLNVSAVELNWTRPQENSNGVSYQLLVYSCTENPLNLSSDSETIVVSGLEPGSHCQFSLSSLANGILGTPLSGLFYTDPSAVVLKVDNRGSNESLVVTWDQAVGGVDLYVLNISSFDMNYSINLSSSCENYTLKQLNAATVYTVTLTTVRGNFYAPSQPVRMATYPNSPGGITIQEIETRSVSLKWAAALGMKNGSFNYSVTYWSSDNNNNSYLTPNNVFLLSNLSYGTIYNISVATIGPMGFQSQPVLKNVTTKPDPVQNLNVVSTTTNSISLEWNLVDGVPKYFVTVYSNSSTTRNTTSSNNMILLNLIPGMQYNISVESCTDDGTKGDAVWQTESTDPAQVDNVVCSGPDLLGPMLILSWSRPLGVYQAFGVSLQSSDFFSEVYTTNSSHIFVGLKYHTNYNVTIWTSSFGKNSTKTNIPCQAGITRPFTPDLTMVTVADVKFNQFTLYFNPGIFNDSNGPVLSYGVLISSNTRDSSVDNTSQLDQSQLECTYSDWKANKCSTYLAVVRARDLGNAGGESIVIGSQSVWNNYLNGQLDANGVYSYAILFSTKYLSNSSALHTFAAYFSISPFSKGVRMSENPVVIWGSAAGTVVAVLLIGVVVLVMACRRKPKDNDSSNVPIHPLRTKVSDPIKVEDYESYYKRQRADSFCGFAEEFENLRPVGTNQTKTVALAPENKSKNRYNNVLPYDLTRVKLSVLSSPFDDYINANYMPGYSSKKEFIAAQGPLPHTVNDFWRLIWEKNVYTVVMLTRCNEQGRVKCEQYWPADTKHFNNLKVTTTSEIPLEDWTIRDLEVKNMKTSEKRSVRHFHFTAWPDHGVPETTELLIHFRHLVREHMDQYSRHSPTLVHCSAGVGRTGTFIAIDRLIYQIERDGAVDVYGIIHDLRMHRTLMVQTEDQYVFLNQCAMDLIRSRTGNNVDLIYQNTTALSIYENFEPLKKS